MALHPDVLKKAQAALDAVVGPKRLPDFSDYESLVYIQAVVKESLRWHNVLPLGAAHRTLEDDEILLGNVVEECVQFAFSVDKGFFVDGSGDTGHAG